MSRIFKGDETILDLLIPLKDEGTITSLKIVLYTDNPDIATVFTFKNVELKGGIYSMRVKDYSFSEFNDGVLNYVASGEINGENFYFERQSNYYVKTPTNYTPAEPCKIIEYTYDVVRDRTYFTAESQGADGFSGVHVDASSYGYKKFLDGNYCGYNAGKLQGILAGVIDDGEGTKDAPYSASQALNIYKWMEKGTTSDEIYIIGVVCKIYRASSEGKDYNWCITTDLDKVSLQAEKSYNDDIIGWYIEDISHARDYSILIDSYFSEPSICVLKGKMYTDIDGSWNRFEDFYVVETHPTNFPLFYSTELVDTTDTEVYTATPSHPIHAFSKVTIDSSPYGEIKYGEGYDVGYGEGYNDGKNNVVKVIPDGLKVSGSTVSEFDFSSQNWEKVYDFSNMFKNCPNLTTLTMPENIKPNNMTGVFSGSTNLQYIDMNNTDLSEVDSLKSLFANLSNLETVVLSGLETFNGTDMDSMFRACSGLTNDGLIGIENIKTTNVTNMGNLFYQCSGITDAGFITNWDMSNVTSIAGMFYGNNIISTESLKGLSLPKVTNMNEIFQTNPLEKLHVDNWYTPSLTTLNNIFPSRNIATEVYINNWDCSSVTTFNNNLWTTNTKKITINNWYCQSLKTLDHAFTNAAYAAEININNWYCPSVTDISYLFAVPGDATHISLGGLKTPNVTNMESVFERFMKLKSVDFNGFISSAVTNMYSLFYGCSGLESIDLSPLDTSSVTNMGLLFSQCTSLRTIRMGGDVSNVTKLGGIFNGVPTGGTFYYNSNYDYSKIIEQLPSGWVVIPF